MGHPASVSLNLSDAVWAAYQAQTTAAAKNGILMLAAAAVNASKLQSLLSNSTSVFEAYAAADPAGAAAIQSLVAAAAPILAASQKQGGS